MIKKARLTTTLAAIRKYHPCQRGWEILLKSLPKDYPQDRPINLLHILQSNGVQDMMWALRAATPDTPKLRVAICADMAARVLKYYEAIYPDDKRPGECIKACRQFVRGKIALAALHKAARCAYAAAEAVDAPAATAANSSAYSAGCAAFDAAYASDADDTAAADTALDAAYAPATDDTPSPAERKAQVRIIRKYLK